MEILYTTAARATGDGRNGRSALADETLDLEMRIPTELGGPGGGSNPEQLLALAWSACFHGTLRFVGRQRGQDVADSAVTSRINVVPGAGGEGFDLAAVLEIELPRVSAVTAKELVEAAHDICPFSRATRGNVPVDLRLVDR